MRILFGVLLQLVVGLFALPWVFSDLGPGETMFRRMAEAGGIFFAGGVLSGALAFRRWPISGLCAWTPVGMGLDRRFSAGTAPRAACANYSGAQPSWTPLDHPSGPSHPAPPCLARPRPRLRVPTPSQQRPTLETALPTSTHLHPALSSQPLWTLLVQHARDTIPIGWRSRAV